MTLNLLRAPALSLLSAILSAQVLAADNARDWLARMESAARSYDYQGVFVYQHGTQIETMRIFHKVTDGVSQERLVSLNGPRREIIRNAHEVRCYYPDDRLVVIEPRRLKNMNFPSILPERLQGFGENYVIQLGKVGRVADRAAQLVLVRPRDTYRYGYRLWADRETGLLLRADLVGEKDQGLEQFVFTHIAIGGGVPASALAPATAEEGMTLRRDGEAATRTDTQWQATRLPNGFQLTTQLRRDPPQRRKSLEHLVYSDGLATVSVFVEKQGDKNDKQLLQGASRMGAVNMYGTQTDGYHVTVVGEVPLATVSLIGASVVRRTP